MAYPQDPTPEEVRRRTGIAAPEDRDFSKRYGHPDNPIRDRDYGKGRYPDLNDNES